MNEKLDVVREIYKEYLKGDITFFLDYLAQDIDWWVYGPSEIPYSGRYKGHEQIRQYFSLVSKTIEILQCHIKEIIDTGDSFVVLGRWRIKIKPTGRIIETDWAHVFELQAGKIKILREYTKTGEIASAFQNKPQNFFAWLN